MKKQFIPHNIKSDLGFFILLLRPYSLPWHLIKYFPRVSERFSDHYIDELVFKHRQEEGFTFQYPSWCEAQVSYDAPQGTFHRISLATRVRES